KVAVGSGTVGAATVQFETGPGSSGTLIFNHTDPDYMFNAALVSNGAGAGPSGAGALEHLAGATTLVADSSAFAGTTMVSGGTLTVADALGGSASVTGGSFVVDGTFGGNVAASTSGIVSGAGTITGDGD